MFNRKSKIFSKAFDRAMRLGVTDYEQRWKYIKAYEAGWKAAKKDARRRNGQAS